MMTVVAVIGFFSILFLFGWQVTRFALREHRIIHLLALSGVVGISLYIFFINLLGYIIPIQSAFVVVLTLFGILVALSFSTKLRMIVEHGETLTWGIEPKWKKILLGVALFITLSTGIISVRQPMDVFTLREPTAATMAEGNFPPKEIWSPDNPLFYHYAPDLFAAGVYKVTGAQLGWGYDIQIAVMSGSLFLLGFLIVNTFLASTFVSFWSAIIMYYAGSLVVFEGIRGIPTLIQHYIFKEEVPAPFKFITDAIGADFGLPTVYYTVGVYWGAMAFALMLAATYIIVTVVKRGVYRGRYTAITLGAFLFALLALVAETFFVIQAGIFFLFPFLLFLAPHARAVWKHALVSVVVLLFIACSIALLQGGALQSAVYQQLSLTSAEKGDHTMLYTDNEGGAPPVRISSPLTFADESIFTPEFMKFWLLLIFILPFAFRFLLRECYELGVLLLSATLIFFVTPLFMDSDFLLIKQNIGRFFYPVNLFGGLAIGVYLASTYTQSSVSIVKRAIIGVALILMAQGLWTHTVWLTLGYPPGQKFNVDATYFVKENTLEARAYSWVKEHTTIDNSFLIIRDEYSECGFSGAPNCLFIFNTGRMAPTFRFHQTTPIDGALATHKINLFDNDVRKRCDYNAVHDLGFDYLYVDERWPVGMEEVCLKENLLERVFEAHEGEKFVRIYAIRRAL